MPVPLPSSYVAVRTRFASFDVAWAVVSPLLALALRDAQILSRDNLTEITLYSAISLTCSVLFFRVFRLHDGVYSFFSGRDIQDIVKLACCAEAMTCIVAFTMTRLTGIPRSTPAIHILVLVAGLVGARLARSFIVDRSRSSLSSAREDVILIGSCQVTAHHIEMLRVCFPTQFRIIAMLDDRAELIGRAIAGVHVMAGAHALERVIYEFQVHGIYVDRVLIFGDPAKLPPQKLERILQVCERHGIGLGSVPDLQYVEVSGRSGRLTEPDRPINACSLPYHRTKRILDLGLASCALFSVLPLLALLAVLVRYQMGSPLFFWQERTGVNGSKFFLLKFRTLRWPLDSEGRPTSEDQRLCRFGRLMRDSRLDELPQLLNVIAGHMSLVGPRPLLPADQPPDPGIRLSVRPGITGWAQVNGGRLLTAAEKAKFDEWYVRNASFWLDVRILALTLTIPFKREGRGLAGVANTNC